MPDNQMIGVLLRSAFKANVCFASKKSLTSFSLTKSEQMNCDQSFQDDLAPQKRKEIKNVNKKCERH
jgi:hypothetical protein